METPLLVIRGPEKELPPSFVECLERMVRLYAEYSAVCDCAGREYSYGALWRQALGVAGALKNAGVASGDVVALGLEKSSDYVAALVGIWMNGSCFVPVDPASPKERLQLLIADSKPRLTICRESHKQTFAAAGVAEFLTDWIEEAPDKAIRVNQPQEKAYLIYTSGSSGRPKGVIIKHQGITNLLLAQIEAFRMGPGDRSLWATSASFDASISDIGCALLSGACLVIPDKKLLAPSSLPELIKANAITHADLAPALLSRIDPGLIPDSFRTVVIGGEVCPAQAARNWAKRFRVINVYGPTETTVCSSLCAAGTGWEAPIIGQPLPNTLYLVMPAPGCNKDQGELWIGGCQLAEGYLHQPGLTEAAFIRLEGERFYRTGDLVKITRNTDLEFLGRIDRQIKVRGHRIEPEEIERELLKIPGVRAAAVGKQAAGNRFLLSAIVEPAVETLTSAEVRASLNSRLPDWLVPDVIKILPQIPLTPHGKTDWASLAAALASAPGSQPAKEAPQNRFFERLYGLMKQVLENEDLLPQSNFFDSGGDSIQVLELISLAERLDISIEPEIVYRYPTAFSLSKALEDAASPIHSGRSAPELERDAVPDREMLQNVHDLRSETFVREYRDILLTGASGFLGGEILGALLNRTTAEIKVLVRAPSRSEAEAKLHRALAARGMSLSAAQRNRLTVVLGDVSKAGFGMPQDEYRRLCEDTDALFHCAAEVNSTATYEMLKPANVEGTKNACAFCFTGKKKAFHFASTLSVFVSTDRNRGTCREDDDLAETLEVFGGYGQSKWVAERFLQNLMPAGADNIFIYRFGLITGHSKSGYSRPSDFLNQLFRDLRILGSVPKEASKALEVDITPVDYAAAMMCLTALRAPSGDRRVFHIANRMPLSLSALALIMSSQGLPVRLVEDAQWKDTCRKGSVPPLLPSLLCRASDSYRTHRALDIFQATDVRFDCRNLEHVLGEDYSEPPLPGQRLLALYLKQPGASKEKVFQENLELTRITPVTEERTAGILSKRHRRVRVSASNILLAA